MRLSCLLHRLLPSIVSSIFLAFATTPALAQPAGARGENFLYRVIAGDTLVDLAQKYTTTSSNWTILQSLNSVEDPYRLSIGTELKIPFSLIPELPSPAQVSHISGEVSVDNAPAKLEDEVAEGSNIRTGANGFITLALADGSVLSVPAASSMQIERLRVFKGTGLIDTIFSIQDGALESSVAPRATGVGRFEIRTPVSITGVRGTSLRVRASDNGAQSEVLSGSAQLNSSQAGNATLRPNQGVAVDAHGKLLGIRPLLPAPALTEPVRGGQGWTASFLPIPGAVSYLVRVATDDAGHHLVSSKHFDAPDITFSASRPGTYYVIVRAVDADGVMGKDAILPFLGRTVLNSSDGSAVFSGYGEFVQLTEF